MPLPQYFKDNRICILGLGYVGLTLAVAMADRGFIVHGLEINDGVLASLAKGEPHFHEPQLGDRLKRVIASKNLTFSRDLGPEIKASVYIITVGTPLGDDGKARVDMVGNAARQVAEHCEDGALVVLRSTIKLGTARGAVAPVLAEHGKSIDLAVCPERTLEGKALIELRENPQIIGADEAEVRFRAMQVFNFLSPITIEVSSLEAAELVKLVDNTFRDVSFGFANEIAKLCSAMGLSAAEIIRAGKLGYPRTNVALPGPVGGPCLEKDPHILIESAKAFGVDMNMTAAARQTNEQQPEKSVKIIKDKLKELGLKTDLKISILGIAFKGAPPTDDIRGTMAKPVLDHLKKTFPAADYYGFDAVVAKKGIEGFGLKHATTLEQAFNGAHLVVFMNNHPSLDNIDLPRFSKMMSAPGIVYDFWAMHLDALGKISKDIHYLPLGGEKAGTRSR